MFYESWIAATLNTDIQARMTRHDVHSHALDSATPAQESPRILQRFMGGI